MADLALIIAMVTAGLGFLMPLLPAKAPFMDFLLCLPAVLLGTASWLRIRTFGRSAPVTLCVLLALVGIAWTDGTEVGRAALLFGYIALPLPIAALIVERRAVRRCANVFVWATVAGEIIAMLFVFIVLGANPALVARFGDLTTAEGLPAANSNQVGFQLGIAAVLAFYLSLSSPRRAPRKPGGRFSESKTMMGAAVFLSVGVLMTASRGATISTLASTLYLFVRTPGALKSKQVLRLAVASAVVIGVVTTVINVSPIESLTSRFSDDTLSTLGGRTPIWQTAFDTYTSDAAYVTWGVGTGGAEKLLGQFDNLARRGPDMIWRRSPHNTCLEWLLCFGLLGVGPGLWLMWAAARQSWRMDRGAGTCHRAAIMVYCVPFALSAVIFRTAFFSALGGIFIAMLSYHDSTECIAKTPPRLQPHGEDTSS